VLQTSTWSGGFGQSAAVAHCGTQMLPWGAGLQAQPLAASDGHAPGAAQSAALAQAVGPGPGAATTTLRLALLEPAAFVAVSVTVNVPLAA
jgi:hypothetical protein